MSPALPGVAAPALSVVAPCYDEERSLPAFVERMIAACDEESGEPLLSDEEVSGFCSLVIHMASCSRPLCEGTTSGDLVNVSTRT